MYETLTLLNARGTVQGGPEKIQ